MRAAAMLLAACAVAFAQDVQVQLDVDRLQISAPGFHFISGKSLDQLRNGASVAYDIQVSVLTDSRQLVLRRSFERFILSYDVWEERFSVTRLRSARSSASRLTAAGAEAWCVEKFSLLTSGLPVDRNLWVRIDIKAGEGRRGQLLETGDDGFSLASLIDLFSKPGKPRSDSQFRAESAPFRIAQLRRPGN